MVYATYFSSFVISSQQESSSYTLSHAHSAHYYSSYDVEPSVETCVANLTLFDGITKSHSAYFAADVTVAWSLRLYVFMSPVTLVHPAKAVGRN